MFEWRSCGLIRPIGARSEISPFRAFCIIEMMAGSPNSSLLVVLVVEDEPLLRMLAVEVVEEGRLCGS